MTSSVHSMAFTAGDLTLENKESEFFSWQETVEEPSSGDFFEQYVMLDGGEGAGSPTGGGESFSHLGGELNEASDMTAFSPLASEGITLPPGRQSSGGGITNRQDDCTTGVSLSLHAHSAYASEIFQSRPQQQEHHQQHRQMQGRPNMPDHGSAMKQRELSMGVYDMPGGGSISDSELLKLEGLTMRSPRVQVPLTSASIPPSPHPKSSSPTKAGRFEAIYAKFRSKAATLNGRSRQQAQQDTSNMPAPAISTAQMGSEPIKTSKTKPYSWQINKPHLPLSPPLTGSMANLCNQVTTNIQNDNSDNGGNNNGMQFVNGYLDDPFFDPSGLLVSMSQSNSNGSGTGPHTPLHTPLLSNFTSLAGEPAQTAPIVWQLGPDGKTFWSPGNISSAGGRVAPMSSFIETLEVGDSSWWDGTGTMDTDDMGDAEAVMASLQQQHNVQSRNATAVNLVMNQLQQQQQQQQQQGGFEYPPLPPGTSIEDFAASGLMIHMPQLRGPAPNVLNSSYYPGAPDTAIGQNGEMVGGGGAGGTSRQARASARSEQQQQGKRPKPRAPSSGARYHHHQPSGAMTSPRKTRTASGSGASGGRTTPSPSPTPGGSGETNHRTLHRRSTSMNTLNNGHGGTGAGATEYPAAIRKRRSWTGRKLGATEAAAAQAAVSVANAIPSVPALPPGMISPQQQQQQQHTCNVTKNIARRVSSTSNLSSPSRANMTGARNPATPDGAGRPDLQQQQQHQLNHGHMLRNNRSMPQLTLQVPDQQFLPPPYDGLPSSSHTQYQPQSSTTTAGTTSSSSATTTRTRKPPKSSRNHHRSHSHPHSSDYKKGFSQDNAISTNQSLGFVNFTPQDHNILMTGVAPSGSTKTKARREKEAAERQRKLSDAVVKAVAAAGTDVKKLEQEGIMLS